MISGWRERIRSARGGDRDGPAEAVLDGLALAREERAGRKDRGGAEDQKIAPQNKPVGAGRVTVRHDSVLRATYYYGDSKEQIKPALVLIRKRGGRKIRVDGNPAAATRPGSRRRNAGVSVSSPHL